MDTIAMYIVFGFIFVWSAAWTWAFFRISSDVLVSMINGVFTLRELAWSAACALLALLPLFIALLVWARFQATFPG
jgi:hypothetical protein